LAFSFYIEKESFIFHCFTSLFFVCSKVFFFFFLRSICQLWLTLLYWEGFLFPHKSQFRPFQGMRRDASFCFLFSNC
jgi:hypothetical protein